MVTNVPMQQQVRQQRQFDSYCKTVLKNEARNIYSETNTQNKRLIVLSALSHEKLNELSICDTYTTDISYFHLKDYVVPVKDLLIANAIQTLSKRDQLIILSFFFLDMSDTEIAKELEIARGTVYYHKKKALEKIKKFLKEHENE